MSGADLQLDDLRQMLAAAGRNDHLLEIEREALTGGRTGARVTRLIARGEDGQRRFVLKQLPDDTWRRGVLAHPQPEAALWIHGLTSTLPAPLRCPMVAVVHRDDGEVWMLMDDVGSGIRPRGRFGDDDERALLRAVARLHAKHWGDPALARLPMSTTEQTTSAWATPTATAAKGPEAIAASPAWVQQFISDFTPLEVLLPAFLELLSKEDADLYLELCEDGSWHRGFDDTPTTLVHGDLRRANISFMDDGTLCLIDWELASRGPAATDLAWHWLLHFWAYPTDDRPPQAHDPLLDLYLDTLEAELDARIDRHDFMRVWEVAWLRALAQLGFCLADLPTNPTEAQRARARARAAAAMARVRRALDAL